MPYDVLLKSVAPGFRLPVIAAALIVSREEETEVKREMACAWAGKKCLA
jgi:hypothetical protein